MSRGRKPKPTAVKKRQGNPGRRPLNEENEIQFEGTTTAPTHLDKHARREWKRLAARLRREKLLTPADRVAFEAYCVNYSRHRRAEEFLASPAAGGSMVYKTKGGALKPWPQLGISERALQLMHRFMVEFGLTPSARARMNIPKGGKPDKDEKFLFGEEGAADECPEDVAN